MRENGLDGFPLAVADRLGKLTAYASDAPESTVTKSSTQLLPLYRRLAPCLRFIADVFHISNICQQQARPAPDAMSSHNGMECCVCGTPSTLRCSACAKLGVELPFCSTEHQKLVSENSLRTTGRRGSD